MGPEVNTEFDSDTLAKNLLQFLEVKRYFQATLSDLVKDHSQSATKQLTQHCLNSLPSRLIDQSPSKEALKQIQNLLSDEASFREKMRLGYTVIEAAKVGEPALYIRLLNEKISENDFKPPLGGWSEMTLRKYASTMRSLRSIGRYDLVEKIGRGILADDLSSGQSVKLDLPAAQRRVLIGEAWNHPTSLSHWKRAAAAFSGPPDLSKVNAQEVSKLAETDYRRQQFSRLRKHDLVGAKQEIFAIWNEALNPAGRTFQLSDTAKARAAEQIVYDTPLAALYFLPGEALLAAGAKVLPKLFGLRSLTTLVRGTMLPTVQTAAEEKKFLFSLPDWGQRIISGLAFSAGNTFAKGIISSVGGRATQAAGLENLLKRLPVPSTNVGLEVLSASKYLLATSHVEAAAQLIIQGIRNGVISGDIQELAKVFSGDNILPSYVLPFGQKSANWAVGRAGSAVASYSANNSQAKTLANKLSGSTESQEVIDSCKALGTILARNITTGKSITGVLVTGATSKSILFAYVNQELSARGLGFNDRIEALKKLAPVFGSDSGNELNYLIGSLVSGRPLSFTALAQPMGHESENENSRSLNRLLNEKGLTPMLNDSHSARFISGELFRLMTQNGRVALRRDNPGVTISSPPEVIIAAIRSSHHPLFPEAQLPVISRANINHRADSGRVKQKASVSVVKKQPKTPVSRGERRISAVQGRTFVPAEELAAQMNFKEPHAPWSLEQSLMVATSLFKGELSRFNFALYRAYHLNNSSKISYREFLNLRGFKGAVPVGQVKDLEKFIALVKGGGNNFSGLVGLKRLASEIYADNKLTEAGLRTAMSFGKIALTSDEYNALKWPARIYSRDIKYFGMAGASTAEEKTSSTASKRRNMTSPSLLQDLVAKTLKLSATKRKVEILAIIDREYGGNLNSFTLALRNILVKSGEEPAQYLQELGFSTTQVLGSTRELRMLRNRLFNQNGTVKKPYASASGVTRFATTFYKGNREVAINQVSNALSIAERRELVEAGWLARGALSRKALGLE